MYDLQCWHAKGNLAYKKDFLASYGIKMLTHGTNSEAQRNYLSMSSFSACHLEPYTSVALWNSPNSSISTLFASRDFFFLSLCLILQHHFFMHMLVNLLRVVKLYARHWGLSHGYEPAVRLSPMDELSFYLLILRSYIYWNFGLICCPFIILYWSCILSSTYENYPTIWKTWYRRLSSN